MHAVPESVKAELTRHSEGVFTIPKYKEPFFLVDQARGLIRQQHETTAHYVSRRAVETMVKTTRDGTLSPRLSRAIFLSVVGVHTTYMEEIARIMEEEGPTHYVDVGEYDREVVLPVFDEVIEYAKQVDPHLFAIRELGPNPTS